MIKRDATCNWTKEIPNPTQLIREVKFDWLIEEANSGNLKRICEITKLAFPKSFK